MNSPLCHPVTIGGRTIGGNLFLAPMAGYTDIPFRSICLSYGADLTYTEMISAEGLYRDSGKTEEMMRRSPDEREYVIQFFMGSLEPIEKAVNLAMPMNPVMFDINCGCPVPKVTKTGSGSAIMRDPKMITAMVKEIKRHTTIPVSVKFRLGWDSEHVNFLSFAQAALDGGADVLTLHPRLRTEGYAPYAHWERLIELREYLDVHNEKPLLIGSGDLFTAHDVIRMLKKCGVDAVMIARGAIGNPFIFGDVKRLAKGEEPEQLTTERRINVMMEHLDKMVERYGERSACHQFRKCATFYLKGMREVGEAKCRLSKAETRDEYLAICQLLTSQL